MSTSKKLIILSGANISSGGPLSIYNYALERISRLNGVEIIAFVGNKDYFFKSNNIHFIELKTYKRFKILKFYFEYIYFYFYSLKLAPNVWISLNDFTPNVKSERLYTYFHNTTIFFEIQLKDIFFSTRAIFQKLYYPLFLRINIKKNDKVIVQQNWIADNLIKLKILKKDKVLIFKPIIQPDKLNPINKSSDLLGTDRIILFYPTRPYGYKNIEFICEVIKRLAVISNVKVELRLTISKNDNLYSRFLSYKYRKLNILWLGNITRLDVEKNYEESTLLIFPSRLESWGLPLTEFSKYNKPIFVIDKPYAYETLSGYRFFQTFNENHFEKVADLIFKITNQNDFEYISNFPNFDTHYDSVSDWSSFIY